MECSGYIFNDGEVVHISDFRDIPESAFEFIKRRPEVLIMPLTTPEGTRFHAGLTTLLEYAERIKAKKTIITHMAVECDYAAVKAQCPAGVEPAYDGYEAEWVDAGAQAEGF